MGPTITNYLSDFTKSFAEEPFNDVDALVLSTISYFYLEHGSMAESLESSWVPLPLAVCGIPQKMLFGNLWLNDFSCDKFLAALLGSPRYYDVLIGYYQHATSHELQSQFAAMTFMLPDDTLFIAYRGTDSSLDGWKENFNLSFMSKVPAQLTALKYLNKIAGSIEGNLILGGHSKGGNLAEFAALMSDEEIYDRICRVYSFDGPGFATPPCVRFFTDEYNDRLRKLIPESSLVGLLMEERNTFEIVNANSKSILQHATVNWNVNGIQLELVTELNPDAQLLSESINSWMKSFDLFEREKLVDTMYEVFEAAGVKELRDIENSTLEYLGKILSKFKELEPDLRAELTDMIMQVFRVYKKQASERFVENRQRLIPDLIESAQRFTPSSLIYRNGHSNSDPNVLGDYDE